jgi:mannose-6-phosphate isomerase-like protein (cupin superfamily)
LAGQQALLDKCQNAFVFTERQLRHLIESQLLCTEMYYVLSGSGAVEMLDQHGFSCIELLPHSALIFSPGTIHRLINPHGDLELLVNTPCWSIRWTMPTAVGIAESKGFFS